MSTKEVTFETKSHLVDSSESEDFERVSVWTDGLSLTSEHDSNWPCWLRLLPNKRYKITITVEEV